MPFKKSQYVLVHLCSFCFEELTMRFNTVHLDSRKAVGVAFDVAKWGGPNSGKTPFGQVGNRLALTRSGMYLEGPQ